MNSISIPNPLDFSGKTVLVVGGSSGIGNGIAQGFRRHGAQVHVWTQRRGDSVVITLRNTVPQGPGPAGSGLALANVRERLHLMHDARCRFRSGLSAGVFEVQMEVPA